jgi:hypothetical protein
MHYGKTIKKIIDSKKCSLTAVLVSKRNLFADYNDQRVSLCSKIGQTQCIMGKPYTHQYTHAD